MAKRPSGRMRSHVLVRAEVEPRIVAKALRNPDISQDIAKMMVDGATEPIQGLLNTIKSCET
jgi:hypothetical protein